MSSPMPSSVATPVTPSTPTNPPVIASTVPVQQPAVNTVPDNPSPATVSNIGTPIPPADPVALQRETNAAVVAAGIEVPSQLGVSEITVEGL